MTENVVMNKSCENEFIVWYKNPKIICQYLDISKEISFDDAGMLGLLNQHFLLL